MVYYYFIGDGVVMIVGKNIKDAECKAQQYANDVGADGFKLMEVL